MKTLKHCRKALSPKTLRAIKVFSRRKKAQKDAGDICIDDVYELCPDDLLELAVPEDLCKWLPLFVAEDRSSKCGHYTPSTISQ